MQKGRGIPSLVPPSSAIAQQKHSEENTPRKHSPEMILLEVLLGKYFTKILAGKQSAKYFLPGEFVNTFETEVWMWFGRGHDLVPASPLLFWEAKFKGKARASRV